MIDKCPASGGDRTADRSEIRRLLSDRGIVREMCDPGGRELTFVDGSKLRLSEWCDSCDIKAVFEFLGIPRD